jgi:hypothetical protein
MQSSARTSDATCSRGVFNFMAADTPPSLFRNGQVLIHRRPDGGTSHAEGFNLEAHALEVRNARLLPAADRRSCEMNGFELVDCPLDDETLDFMDHQEVVRGYYHQCSRLVSAVTGAPAYAFDHNVRSASGQQADARIRGGQGVQPPAHLVHGDYTLRGAPERLQQLTLPPSGNDTYRDLLPPGEALISSADAERALAGNGRFAIINVWRNIASEPVATHPLALCDGRTVEPDDLVVFEIHYPDRIGENYFARYAPRQTMYFYPRMARDEALLIKQWDSAGSLARSNGNLGDGSSEQAPCTFSFHSAFDDPDTPPDAPDRWSIEVRCMVIYD